MNRQEKIYTAPSAEMLLLVPKERLAAFDWKFSDQKWYNGYIPATNAANGASAVGIVNGGLGIENSAWAEDGYTIKKSS